MILNGETLARTNRGFRALYEAGAATYTPTWPKVAMESPSTTDTEEYSWLGAWPRMREWVGPRVAQSLSAHGFTIRNRDFEATVTVKATKIKDDKIGAYANLMRGMGIAAAQHPDEMVYSLFGRGWSEPCYDKQPFFDDDHPVRIEDREISVSNVLRASGAAEPAWYLIASGSGLMPFIYQIREPYNFVAKDDLRSSDHVFNTNEFIYGSSGRGAAGFGMWQLCYASNAPLTASNFNTLYARMTSQKGPNGRALGITPTLLVVPAVLREQALTLIKAEQINGTTNINRNTVDVHVSPWL